MTNYFFPVTWNPLLLVVFAATFSHFYQHEKIATVIYLTRCFLVLAADVYGICKIQNPVPSRYLLPRSTYYFSANCFIASSYNSVLVRLLASIFEQIYKMICYMIAFLSVLRYYLSESTLILIINLQFLDTYLPIITGFTIPHILLIDSRYCIRKHTKKKIMVIEIQHLILRAPIYPYIPAIKFT